MKPFCANTWLSESFRVYYNQSVVIIQYFFPLLIISGAYIRMGFELWRAEPPGNREETRDAVVLQNKIKVCNPRSTRSIPGELEDLSLIEFLVYLI